MQLLNYLVVIEDNEIILFLVILFSVATKKTTSLS